MNFFDITTEIFMMEKWGVYNMVKNLVLRNKMRSCSHQKFRHETPIRSPLAVLLQNRAQPEQLLIEPPHEQISNDIMNHDSSMDTVTTITDKCDVFEDLTVPEDENNTREENGFSTNVSFYNDNLTQCFEEMPNQFVESVVEKTEQPIIDHVEVVDIKRKMEEEDSDENGNSSVDSTPLKKRKQVHKTYVDTIINNGNITTNDIMTVYCGDKNELQKKKKKQKVIYKCSLFKEDKVNYKGLNPGKTVYLVDYYYEEGNTDSKFDEVIWIVEDK